MISATPTRSVIFQVDALSCSNVKTAEDVAFFKAQGKIVTLYKTHYVYSGAVELLTVVGRRYPVAIEGAEPLAKKLMKMAFGKEGAREMRTKSAHEAVRVDAYMTDVTEMRSGNVFYLTGLLLRLLEEKEPITPQTMIRLRRMRNQDYTETGYKILKREASSLELTRRMTWTAKRVLSEALRAECLLRMQARKQVFLDIDQVLSYHRIDDIGQAAFFHTYGMIIHAVCANFVFPGVKELIQALFDRNVSVGFYSFGPNERNIPFVKELLERSLGRYPDGVPILNERVKQSSEVSLAEFKKYRKFTANDHKDLGKALEAGDELENKILVDDSRELSVSGQTANLLYATFTDSFRISSANKRAKLSYCIFEKPHPLDLEKVEDGEAIVVQPSENEIFIHFIDKDSWERRKLVLDDASLISMIRHKSKGLANSLLAWVAAHNGKTTRISRYQNHIYYIAGLLFSVLDEAEKSGQTLAKTLFKRQYKKVQPNELEPHKYESQSNRMWACDRYYHLGLNILRRYNPQLEFMTPERYKAACQIELSPELVTKYKGYMEERKAMSGGSLL